MDEREWQPRKHAVSSILLDSNQENVQTHDTVMEYIEMRLGQYTIEPKATAVSRDVWENVNKIRALITVDACHDTCDATLQHACHYY